MAFASNDKSRDGTSGDVGDVSEKTVVEDSPSSRHVDVAPPDKPEVPPSTHSSEDTDEDHDSDHDTATQDEEERQDRRSSNVARSHSRSSSVFSRSAAVVPRSQRRGLLGRFAIIPEVDRPWGYRNKTKWILTSIVAFAAAAAPLGSAIFYPALPQMTADLRTTPTITNLAVAFYMLAMSIFPLWWSSFSETLGRRTIYLISFSLFVVFSVLSAVSVNISMLIVMRILSGGASASVQAVGAGTIADLWEPRERGRAMGFFYLGPLTGPLFAPIIGGALSQEFGWRSTMWFLTIFGAVILVLVFFGLPETLPRRRPPVPDAQPSASGTELSRLSTMQSVHAHTKRTGRFLKRCFVDPLEVLLYLRFPPVLITVYFAAIAFGSLFVLNISIQATFSRAPYAFSEIVVGLLYFPPSLGYVLASLLGGRWIDYIMAREAKRAGRYDAAGKLVYLPEDRMCENAWLAAALFPGALVWYGWTAQKGLHWIVPSLANFFFGIGSMLVFSAVTTMLTEFMPRRSSSGVAVNNFVRNIFSCAGAIVAQPLINAMGNGWLCTMVGLFALVTGNACIWALKRFGSRWRTEMDEKLDVRAT